MKTLTRILSAIVIAGLAFGSMPTAEAAKKKTSGRKFTPAMKQASMGKARAMCMEAKNRRGRQFIRAEITDDGRLYCWYR